MEGESYKFQFINYEMVKGYAEYYIRVTAPNNISFHLKDRYSSMLNLYATLVRERDVANMRELPKFPSKKSFGNKKP